MTKQQFLDELRDALTGEVAVNVMMDSYNYYSHYIDEEIRAGKTEAQVLEELGKPMLIARSIIAAQEGERNVDYEYTEDGHNKTVRNNPFKNRESGAGSDIGSGLSSAFANVMSKILLVLVLLVLFLLFFLVIKIGVWVFVTFGIPILLVLGIIYLVMYFSS
ncbi:MAG: DUF1700 domain-containing protein [Lachnospiraceae bacterium]|nr:DUF1700 domain-containing protein [Lachnospiraceae bacterium]